MILVLQSYCEGTKMVQWGYLIVCNSVPHTEPWTAYQDKRYHAFHALTRDAKQSITSVRVLHILPKSVWLESLFLNAQVLQRMKSDKIRAATHDIRFRPSSSLRDKACAMPDTDLRHTSRFNQSPRTFIPLGQRSISQSKSLQDKCDQAQSDSPPAQNQ